MPEVYKRLRDSEASRTLAEGASDRKSRSNTPDWKNGVCWGGIDLGDRCPSNLGQWGDREEVGHLFENYNLNSACVVDKNNKLVGMITSDDILTVLKEEAEEDALRLAGVGNEEITDGLKRK